MIRTRAASTVLLADGDALGARGGEPCADKLDHLLKAQAVRDHERLAKAAPLPALKPLERVKGIEPSSSAWKAVALPLSYTRAGILLHSPVVSGAIDS